MTTDQRFERDLPELLAQLAPRVVPDYRDEVVGRTATMGQRPAWRFPGRWLPIEDVAPGRGRSRTATVLVTALVVTALIVAMLAAVVGSQRRPLPAPFGPALNGAIYYAASGDIYRMASLDAAPLPVVAAGEADTNVVLSKDGTMLAIVRPVGNGFRLMVADADGSGVRPLDGVFRDWTAIDWSPDGRELVLAADIDGRQRISIVPVDGSKARLLDLGFASVEEPVYLPDGRILAKGQLLGAPGETWGLYLIDPVAGTASPIGSPSTNPSDIIAAAPSPDGRIAVYHRWREPDEKGRIRIIDLQTGADTALAVEYPAEEFADENAQISPDGRQILFTRFLAAGNQLVLVPASGGTGRPIGELTPGNDAPIARFAPDGRTILARYHNGHVWELDATGSGTDRQLDMVVTDLPAWQRRAE